MRFGERSGDLLRIDRGRRLGLFADQRELLRWGGRCDWSRFRCGLFGSLLLAAGFAVGLGFGVGRFAFGSDAFQQDAGRLVVGILRDELPFERSLQDRLAEPLRSSEARVDRLLGGVDPAEVLIDEVDDFDQLRLRRY